MMGLSDGRKSFKVGLVVLIQYRLWHTATQPATQPASHVAVAIRLYAIASSPKTVFFSLHATHFFGIRVALPIVSEIGSNTAHFQKLIQENSAIADKPRDALILCRRNGVAHLLKYAPSNICYHAETDRDENITLVGQVKSHKGL